MTMETLKYERQGNVGIVTLNRPQRLNAVSFGMRGELSALLVDIRKDDEVNCIVITGGPRTDGRPCFSAGGDLKERNDQGGNDSTPYGFDTWEEGLILTLTALGENFDHTANVWNEVAAFPKPTIAAVDGICTAGGLELALACDLRVVADTAQISDLHMLNLGGLGGGGLQTRLPRVVGLAKAKELLWTGEVIGGEEAVRVGLANRVFPSAKLMDGAMQLANRIASMRGLGLKVSKAVLNSSFSQTEYQSLRFSAFADTLLRTRNLDHVAEVYKAFAEKRNPQMG